MIDIPSIAYNSNNPEVEGIEIVRIEDVFDSTKITDDKLKNPSQLEFYILAFYTGGESAQTADFNTYSIQKNSLVYLTKTQIVTFDTSPSLTGYFIIFTRSYFEKCFRNLSNEVIFRLFSPHLYNPVIQIPENSGLEDYINLLHQEFYKKEQRNKEIIINSLFSIVLTKAEQLKQVQTPHFKEGSKLKLFSRFTTLLEENYHKNRNANFYADELAITYKHLNILCHSCVKKTAKHFIDDFIILEAKKRLVNSDVKGTELAYIMGFDEPSNFVKYFKKITGVTPNLFKKQYF